VLEKVGRLQTYVTAAYFALFFPLAELAVIQQASGRIFGTFSLEVSFSLNC